MTPLPDSPHLRAAGRKIPVPFRVRIRSGDGEAELVCNRVLRVLPKKRLVCAGAWRGGEAVAKFFLDPRGGNRHRDREERGANALAKAGIPTPECLFTGTAEPGGIPVLGFRRLSRATDLSTAWARAADNAERIRILSLAVTAMADLHAAGLVHTDPHLENFLIRGEDLFLIDGEAIVPKRRERPLSVNAALKNLGLLFAQVYPVFDALAPEVFRVYVEKRGWPAEKRLFTRLTKEIHSQRNTRKQKYLRKTLRECSAFVCRRTRNRFTVCDRDFATPAMAAFLADPDPVMARGRMLKNGNTATVVRVTVDGRDLVVKRYNIKNRRHALNRAFRAGRARISWKNAHRLRILGIPTPKPVALVERRWGPLRSVAYFVTEFVEGTNARRIFHRVGADKTGDLAAEFGRLYRRLARARISHGDAKATNYIRAGEDLFIVDLDAMREHRSTAAFRRAFRKDLDRFMRNWADLPETGRAFRKEIDKLRP